LPPESKVDFKVLNNTKEPLSFEFFLDVPEGTKKSNFLTVLKSKNSEKWSKYTKLGKLFGKIVNKL